jgi:hypothetical protein
LINDRVATRHGSKAGVRDRRFAIRYPLAADAELIDLESGARAAGVTSDISPGGCFICTSKPMACRVRVRILLRRKNETVSALAVVRVVKPRIGMGVEFLDIEAPHDEVLFRWIDRLRQNS